MKNLRPNQRGRLELVDNYEALIYLFGKSQENSFNDTIKDIRQHRFLSKKDRLPYLSPFFESGFLRIGDRTKRISLTFDAQHLFLLDSNEHSIQMYMQNCHKICMHIEFQYTRNYIQQR